MTKEILFKKFEDMFPNWAKKVTSYRKIGSRTLAIFFALPGENGDLKYVSRVFLYINDDNWQFGTKLWRKRPERLSNKQFNSEEDINE